MTVLLSRSGMNYLYMGKHRAYRTNRFLSVELRTRRSGLGCADRQSFKSTFGNITSDSLFQFLKDYADDERQYEDLEFSDDFSHKEKKKLYG